MAEFFKRIGEWVTEHALQVFPLPMRGTAGAFAQSRIEDPKAVEFIRAAEIAIQKSDDKVVAHIAEKARAMFEQEDLRQNSVMGRAQSLFFAVALLSSLLSVGAGFLVSSRSPHAGEVLTISVFAFFLVIQVILLVMSLTRAIGGLGYPRAGASDFARWAGFSEMIAVHRDEAICTLDWYRQSAHINSWRFGCLERALRALRNIVVCSGLLVVVVLVFANLPSHLNCTDRSEFRNGAPVSYSVDCPIEAVK